MVDKQGTKSDVLKVRDMKGEEKQDEEAVMVWKNHFEGILNAGQPGVGKRQNGILRETPYSLTP